MQVIDIGSLNNKYLKKSLLHIYLTKTNLH